MQDGIVYVTEDRKLEGFFETMSIGANINMGLMANKGSVTNVVNMAEARRAADEWIKALNIKTINRNAKMIELSGGNQQKVVIAKSLIQKPKLIRRADPRRRRRRHRRDHQLINKLADEGLAVMVISLYLPEIMNLCFSYALASLTQEPLLFKGDDFSKTYLRAA